MDWSLLTQASWSLVVAMTRRAKTLPANVALNVSRARILQSLERRPGKSLAGICDDLQLHRGTARHHLHVLERAGAVESHRTPHTTHYFPAALAEDRTGLTLLHRERSLDVAQKVMERPGIRQGQLLREIGMDRKVWRGYRSQLTQEGLLVEEGPRFARYYHPTSKLVRLVSLVNGSRAAPARPASPREGGAA